ncbi:M10 family metallopeptidase C-terminal domain-containing protein [Aquabacterium humicola]|uniref:M10 family metallopeptidase C-terminal domain-containing protein n=1 Tax=Aquabacterium humicola TaxID=3237377 RepID=UPI002543CB85|nr:M10 family metallopeptidase C-terminal domain-containing protein [Rubrivivax pictus]
MADPTYRGSSGDDRIDQDQLGPLTYTDFDLGAGNDVLRLRLGSVLGGAGDDRIELLGGLSCALFYYSSPSGITVDLQQGFALDGFGTRDTLVGDFFQVNGSGYADRITGNALDNLIAPDHGKLENDVVDGRGGYDTVVLNQSSAHLRITVSVDGRRAVITDPDQPDRRVELVDVEALRFDPSDGTPGHSVQLADLIDPFDYGRVGLVGRDTQRWNAGAPLGTTIELTYSFVTTAPASGPGSSGFRAFDPAERAVVQALLAQTAAFSGIRFREVPDGSGVQLRLGVSEQAATRGVAYAPDQPGDSAGDVWMDRDTMRDLSAGSEGRAALLHELGHALGLRHPRNVDAGDAYAEQWRGIDDVVTFSAMAAGANPSGLFRADWGPHDVIALRTLYGSVPMHAGDDVYRLDDAAGRTLSTLVDDGGRDVLDASAVTIGASIDLRAGRASSIGRHAEGGAALDNVALVPGSEIESAIGSAFDDALTGNALDNRLDGGAGNDLIDGQGGRDVAVYAGRRADHAVQRVGTEWRVQQPDAGGTDMLQGIERLAFDDQWLALDIAGAPTETVRLVGALFGRSLIGDATIVGIGIRLFESGLSMQQVAELALATDLFVQLAGSRGHADLVRQLYRNVIGVAPTAAEQAPFVALLDSGAMSPAALAALAASHALNDVAIDLVGLADQGIAYVPS